MRRPSRAALRRFRPRRRGIPLRALVPNAVTALALCFGLTGVRFAISAAGGADGDWEKALLCIITAGVLDGLDGRIARLMKGESRFGAELDSLSDVIAFGVAPALVMYLWSLQHVPQYGWLFALAHGVCCALRLARFNAAIDAEEQPHKSAGYLTGVPAPAAAGLAMLPVYCWLWTGLGIFREPLFVAPWMAAVALLTVSSVATFSFSALRPRSHVRFGLLVVIALLGGALVSATWTTLTVLALLYVGSIPFGIASYAKVRRLRATPASSRPFATAPPAAPAPQAGPDAIPD